MLKGVEGDSFVRICRRKYGINATLCFRYEPWLGGEVLKGHFSILFNISIDKNIYVKDMVITSGLDEVGEEICLLKWKN
jgi:hypothetical protein